MPKQRSEFRSEYFDIDLYRLDWEWWRQSRIYRRKARKLVKAEDRLSRAKAAFEVAKAEIEMEVRAKPKKYRLEKVTDAAVKARVLVHGEYQEAQEEVFKAEKTVGELKAALRTLEHKKTSLEKLTELQGRDYFAEPKSKSLSRMEEQTKRKVRGGKADDE